MRLQINKSVFSFTDKYDITNEAGEPVYRVQGHFFTIGKKLEMHDIEGNEIAQIHQRLISLVSEYDILQHGKIVAVVKQHMFSTIRQLFTVESIDGVYEIEGDWLYWNYKIRTQGHVVAEINQEFAIFQDQYGMEIVDAANVPMLVCLAIVIDEISHTNEI